MNYLAIAWKLGMYQVWNRKRRGVTIALLLFAPVIVLVAAVVNIPERAEFYQKFVTIALGWVLIPFVSLFWGSGAISDEIEGKTLVYLWTRPRHRGSIIFGKVMVTWLWLALLALMGTFWAYLFAYFNSPAGGLAENLPIMFWDWRALSLTAMAWSSVGFLLSVFTKRPLIYGLLIAYLWELIPKFGPGFFRRLSITQQMEALATHKSENEESLISKLIEQVTITETEALLSLLGIIVVFSALGIWKLQDREFLSDDPARNQ